MDIYDKERFEQVMDDLKNNVFPQIRTAIEQRYKKTDAATLVQRVSDIESIIGSATQADDDNIINKVREMIAFFANIAEESTLAGLLSTINTSIQTLGNIVTPNKGVCSTASATLAKDVTVVSSFSLTEGATVIVTFENNVPANSTLNVNSNGAVPIYYRGAAIVDDIIKAGDTVMMYYNGTNFIIIGGGGSANVDGTITVSLVPVVSGSQYAASLLNGVTVELWNVSDNKTVETKTWAGSQLSFTKIMAAKTYKLKFAQKYGYATPQDSQEFVLGVGETYNVGTVEYTADKYVLNVSTNQSDHTDLASTVIRVSATGISADGYLDFTGSQTDLEVLVPKGTTPTAACSSGQPSANNYKQTITVVAATNPSGSTPTTGSITALYETEILTVSITKDSGSGNMSTPTITVKNGNTTIGTLHNGDSLKVAYSINYVCSASQLEGYSTPASVTKNWANTTAKSLTFQYLEEKGVDLGLPSGRKWAEANVGATNAWEIGLYFSWGNVIGHAEGSGYNFDQNTYNGTPGAGLSGDIAVGTTYDAARAIMGGSWRMPTKDEFQELYDNTDSEWVADYHGIAGRKFMKKTNHNVFIFLPAAGYYNGTTLLNRGSYGYYWSRSIYSSAARGYSLGFYSGAVNPQNSNYRYCGQPVRAVQ